MAQVTVSGDADEAASVAYSGTDADSVTEGHQVDLRQGRNAVTVKVTAEAGNTKDYTVNINRGSEDPYGWSAGDDFDTLAAAENGAVTGLWSDGTTMWVADDADGQEWMFAYSLATKQRDPSKEFDLRRSSGDTNVRNIWSDGTTLWVVDEFASKLYAAGRRAAGPKQGHRHRHRRITPDGLWSDGTTMWVTDSNGSELYAYTLATKQRDPSKDIDTGASVAPVGLWSDGTPCG